ncbi:threonine ammonia-lyase [Thalassobaculum sp.]|uniref:threonine ammonia-lyase n=1 Tax=Thalassobaculum sp. TaxID=2022740 RepID=UPI0032EC2D30
MPFPVDLHAIQSAASLIRGSVVHTPTVASPTLSRMFGCRLSLKLETQQHTSSFKERGALVKLSGLDADERRRGVIAMSAGNHAQGVAYHAARLGIPATIVMPETTPFSKVERTRAHGAQVVLRGRTLADCRAETERLVAEKGFVLVHPYDDPDIIRGQGTIGLEVLDAVPDVDTLLVPIGGGGLISGIAIAAKALKPAITIVGVQVDSFPSMVEALGGLPPTSGGSTLAEGIAVKHPGGLTQAIVSELVDHIVVVPERAIERAVQLLIEEQRLVVEGAGAAGIAALIHEPERFAGQRVATVICGGNIDSRILASVMMRGLVRDGRLVRLRIEISDEPGVLATVAQVIGETGGNIVEIYHQRLFQDVPVKQADLDAVIETRNADHVREILARFAELGMPARLLGTSAIDGAVI